MCGYQAAAGQDALEKKVGMLETHQREIHDALASMEGEATRLYQARTPPAFITHAY
jgi:nuclear pore complex protein Nup62